MGDQTYNNTDPGAYILAVLNGITSPTLSGTGNRALYSDPNGVITNTASDRSLKQDITPVDPFTALAQTLQLKPVYWHWINKRKFGYQREIGFVAQDVDEVISEVVGENSDFTLSLDYSHSTAVLAGGM